MINIAKFTNLNEFWDKIKKLIDEGLQSSWNYYYFKEENEIYFLFKDEKISFSSDQKTFWIEKIKQHDFYAIKLAFAFYELSDTITEEIIGFPKNFTKDMDPLIVKLALGDNLFQKYISSYYYDDFWKNIIEKYFSKIDKDQEDMIMQSLQAGGGHTCLTNINKNVYNFLKNKIDSGEMPDRILNRIESRALTQGRITSWAHDWWISNALKLTDPNKIKIRMFIMKNWSESTGSKMDLNRENSIKLSNFYSNWMKDVLKEKSNKGSEMNKETSKEYKNIKISQKEWNSMGKVAQYQNSDFKPEVPRQLQYKYEGQNVDPNGANFSVRLDEKEITLPTNVRRKMNNAIHDLGSYFESIPLERYKEILNQNNCAIVMEDGTLWEGILFAPICGSGKEKPALLQIAYKDTDFQYKPTKSCLVINACRSESKSKNPIECVTYIS